MIFSTDTEHVKVLGRTYYRDNIRWCAFSASGVEFAAKTDSLSVEIFGDDRAGDPENAPRIGIFVNGERVVDRMIENRREKLVIYEGSERAMIVRIIKLTESAMSTFGIGEIDAGNGDIIPTFKKNFMIEFVGDSITCGYGVDDEDENHTFHTYSEDCTKAFAYRTAEALGVDYSLVSFSGYGVISGYTGDGVINSKELLPPHYEKVGFSYATSGTPGDTFKVEDIRWNFERQPDMVFVNLGTNDASYCGEDPDKQKLYIERYVELLKKIRKNNPKAYLMCGLGIMGDVLYKSMCEAAAAYTAQTGDTNIDTVYFEAIRPDSEGYVADYHPRAVTHARCSAVLVDKLKEVAAKKLGRVLGQRVLALSFDDGPNTVTTPQVLEKLKKYGVVATFFLVGDNINEASSAVVRECIAAGNDIENHSIHHYVMSDMKIEDVLKELEEDSDRIEAITGRRPEFFRPPYIAVSDAMRAHVPYTMIAGYGAEDWEDSVSATERAKRILAAFKNGIIILLHDEKGNYRTVEALDTIIPVAKALGYEFVTIPELFKRMDVTPVGGVVYNEAEQAVLY
ncbi:MAG: polysaccharide deacetylase family protein [Lachnospiraceae bacterium]|nr:polysaccharide deacetylase family protein [Lachnospiraceae bacterium]